MRSVIELPIVVKIGFDTSVAVVKRLAEEKLCDAISLSNTAHWQDTAERIDWQKLFGTDVSPLAKYGDGALSGWPLVSLAIGKVKELRQAGITLPIIAGGGIGCRRSWRRDVDALKKAGASAVSFGSAAILRPWRIKNIISYAEEV